jgi:hypothetical protein
MTVAPVTTGAHRPAPPAVHYDFAAPAGARLAGVALRLLGVHAGRSGIRVGDDVLEVAFGPWRVRTPLDNVAGADVDGPYPAWKVIGPHLSLADRGLTLGTSTRAGACIRFHEPVPGIEPTGLLAHPSLTVTVQRPHLLVRRLRQYIAARTGMENP